MIESITIKVAGKPIKITVDDARKLAADLNDLLGIKPDYPPSYKLPQPVVYKNIELPKTAPDPIGGSSC